MSGSAATRALRDAVSDAARRATDRGTFLDPALVTAAPAAGSGVTVRWRGAELELPYSDHLTDLAVDQVVVVLSSEAFTPFVGWRLTGTTDQP